MFKYTIYFTNSSHNQVQKRTANKIPFKWAIKSLAQDVENLHEDGYEILEISIVNSKVEYENYREG